MTEADVYAGLTEILRDIFMQDELVATPELSAKDVEGWDSFKQIEVVIATEERFGLKFSNAEIDGLKSVGDLARLVSSKVKS